MVKARELILLFISFQDKDRRNKQKRKTMLKGREEKLVGGIKENKKLNTEKSSEMRQKEDRNKENIKKY